jgi:hypothetical protein
VPRMKTITLSRVLCLVVIGVLQLNARPAAAQSDPVALVVNRGSDTIDVIDVNAGTAWAPFASGSLGSRPTDVVYDEKSGRIFVSQSASIGSFNARLPDGRGAISIPASGEGSSIALDPVGRRIFVSYRSAGGGQTDGLVNEISIANPAAAVVTQRIVPGIPDLTFIAWDALNRRVYVVADDGRVARTSNAGWTWSNVGGSGVPSPGGILADPSGGVWITGRAPARLMRFNTADVVSTYTMNAAKSPRGLNFDPLDPGVIFIAVDDIARIRKYSIATNTFINSMSTGTRPQDVVKTTNGWLVSANRLTGNGTPGNVSINVPGNLAANTNRTVPVNIQPTALVSVDVPRLFAEPSSGNYCYRRTGDTSTKTFTLQNTRVNRARMDLGPVSVAGLNPANYVLTGANTCNAARLNWGDSCTFSLRFTASGPSNQPPPPPFGPPPFAYWPAQVSVTSTDASATATIALRADVGLCTLFSF